MDTNDRANDRLSSFETACVHAGRDVDPLTGAINPPIVLSSTFVQAQPGEHKGYHYSRAGNPTRDSLERALALLEKGRHAFAYSSGCAAATNLLLTLRAGDHVLACDDLYGGTYRLMTGILANLQIEASFTDFANLNRVTECIRPNTKLIWVETPSNPLLKICDLMALADIARARRLVLAVDNTIATPALQRPLELGATVIVESTTKYISGHSDVLGGALVTSDETLADQLRLLQKSIGAVPSPLDCSLIMRGMQTLAIRVERQVRSAQKIAEWLTSLQAVKRVYYPGLTYHPDHVIATRQMSGPGAIISFDLNGGAEAVPALIKSLRVFKCAISLGGVESLIEHPSSMTHAMIPEEVRYKSGIGDGLLRLSIGIESSDDLIHDLQRGFDAFM